MLRLATILFLTLVTGLPALAVEKPSLTIRPDRPDCLYSLGDTAVLFITRGIV